MTSRRNRIAAAVLFAALLTGGFDTRIVRVIGGGALPPTLSHELPPGMQRFFDRVRAATPPGARIAFLMPADGMLDYAYPFFRANYTLAGRLVVPAMIARTDSEPKHPDAEYVARWGSRVELPDHEILWSESAGTLARRR